MKRREGKKEGRKERIKEKKHIHDCRREERKERTEKDKGRKMEGKVRKERKLKIYIYEYIFHALPNLNFH